MIAILIDTFLISIIPFLLLQFDIIEFSTLKTIVIGVVAGFMSYSYGISIEKYGAKAIIILISIAFSIFFNTIVWLFQ